MMQRFNVIVCVEIIQMEPVAPENEIGQNASRTYCQVNVDVGSDFHVTFLTLAETYWPARIP